MTRNRKRWLIALLAVVLGAGGYFAWQKLGGDNLPSGFASGNGRIEAVEIDIATKAPGRIRDILAREGDLVSAGQALAQMDTVQLEAQYPGPGTVAAAVSPPHRLSSSAHQYRYGYCCGHTQLP